MLLMSSSMLTALPTPAPPKSPILPPLANGTSRSMTLMPVTSRSWPPVCSSNDGGGRWIGRYSLASTGPRLSCGLPSTSMMRPSVPWPTGTEIGAPVACTASPRFRPSEAPMAIVRTTPSPSCCWTSSVRSTSLSFKASYTCGIDSRGNSTSMTAPMIWVIFPSPGVAMVLTSSRLNRCRAAHDLRKLLRDRGLAGLVVDQLQFADELAGVVGSRAHGDHARRHLGGDVLDRRAIDLRLDVAHQQAIEDAGGVRLVDIVPVLLQPFGVERLDRQQLLRHGLLRHGVDELRVDEEQPIELAGAVGIQHHFDGADEILDARLVAEVRDVGEDRKVESPEEGQRLGADQAQAHRRALPLPLADQFQRLAEHVGVQRSGKATIGGDDDDADGLGVAREEERVAVVRVRLSQVADDLQHARGVGARQLHALLRAAHLAGRHHLHRLGDLLSALHTRDLGADFLGAGHCG